MKIKALLLLMLISVILTSCEKHKSDLYILTSTINGLDEKQVRKDSLTMVDSDYFEVSLESMANGTLFKARKELSKPSIGKEFHMGYFEVVDGNGKSLRFKTSSEFLNFMSLKGYDMADQTKSKYQTDYTFKRK